MGERLSFIVHFEYHVGVGFESLPGRSIDTLSGCSVWFPVGVLRGRWGRACLHDEGKGDDSSQ